MRFQMPSITLVLVLASALAPPLPADEVNLSRLEYTLAANVLPMAYASVPKEALHARCRDGNGCLVTLRIDGAAGILVVQSRLFLSETTTRWASLTADAKTDKNSTVSYVAALFSSLSACIFTDADDAVNSLDNAEGFSLYAYSLDSGTDEVCTYSIED